MRCTRYNIMWQFVSDLRQVGGFLLVLWFPPGTLVSSWYSGFLLLLWFPPGTLVSSPPWYNWNIVESDVKHHKFNHQHDTLILADIYPKIFFLNFMRSSSFFSSPGLWARWAIVITFRLSSIVRRPSVNISHFNFLLRKHWTNCNQTLVEWSLDGPFQNCVRWSRLPTKMATKLKIEKRGDEILIVHCCFSVSQNELKF
jgi:hypothetical protein